MKYFSLLSACSALLLACAAPDTIDAPPPELLPESEVPAFSTTSAVETAQVRTEQATQSRAFLPGLTPSAKTRDSIKTGPADLTESDQSAQTVPFELELMQQRKRIQLGLESEQRAQNPVDNVIHLDF